MSQKKSQQTEEKKSETSGRHSSFTLGGLVNVLAFLALAASAILLVVGPVLTWILQHTGGTVIMQALSLVAQYCLLAAIAIPGWFFVQGKRRGWRIAYFVFLVIYIVGTILGVVVGI